MNAIEAISIFNNLKDSCKSEKELKDFVPSKEIMEMPYAKIKAVMFAAVLANYISYRNCPSSHADININSIVLPYVDIFCTDKGNKELITHLGFDSEFEVGVFSSRNNDLEGLNKRLSAFTMCLSHFFTENRWFNFKLTKNKN